MQFKLDAEKGGETLDEVVLVSLRPVVARVLGRRAIARDCPEFAEGQHFLEQRRRLGTGGQHRRQANDERG